MDIDDVARRLATTVRHVRRLVLERRIAHYKVGGKLRFDRVEIEAWVAATRVPAEPDIGIPAPAIRSSGGSTQHRPLRPVPRRPPRRNAS
jgi:excisionase family DNA binding protein